MSEKLKACKSSDEDLRKTALKHYEDVSSEAHSWLNVIPRAINFYFDNKNKEGIEKENEELREEVKELNDILETNEEYQVIEQQKKIKELKSELTKVKEIIKEKDEEIERLKDVIKIAKCKHSFDVDGVCELCGLGYQEED